MKTSIITIGFAGSVLLLICSVSPAATIPVYTVNTVADHDDGICDANDCTLREALHVANAGFGPALIHFAPNVTGTITLTQGELAIRDSVSVIGPGARVLSVDANLASRVFSILAAASPNINVTISGLTLTRGQANDPDPGSGGPVVGGGIINLSGSNTTLTNCTISDCSALGAASQSAADPGEGGAIYNTGTLTLVGCTFRGNSAIGGSIPNRGSAVPGGEGVGGAVYNDNGDMTLQNCTLSGNRAQGGHGGNNTLGGKGGAGGGAVGGAIAGRGSPARLNFTTTNCTVSGNIATGGTGGLGNPAGSDGRAGGGGVQVNGMSGTTNTLIAGNDGSEAPDVSGPFQSGGFNLVGNTAGGFGFTGPGDKTDSMAIPLNISPLANNGGATDTMALLTGSVAINSGTASNTPPRDQRNYLRSGVPDIGAYEFGGTIPVTLANISTRLSVDTGDNALIGGFIVTGTHDKRVIVLAVGPSLPFPDKLANPTLELYSGNTLLESNDDWVTSANKQAIMDSGAAPGNNLESAIIRTLPANNAQYTAIVRGANNSKGIGSVQVYDLDRTTDSKLANISTRGVVQAGDNIMIAGFIVSGADQQKVIVLAIGPSLTVPGKLPDPTLQLVNQQGTILDENDNWGDSANKQAIMDSGVVPSNAAESAIIATLPSGNAQYTAIVRGVGGATGVAVVQVYALN